MSLADRVFSQLEQDILSERYPPGALLTESKISQSLGVSRTPVREAVRRLEQAGLLQECAKGLLVIGVSFEDLADIYEIRRRLEGLAARRATEAGDEELHLKLQNAVELQEFYTLKGDAEQLQSIDSRFHEILYENCGSILRDTLTSLHRRIRRYRKDSVTDLERAQLATSEHRAIYEAIVAGDASLAERLTVVHICNAYESILKKENN